MAAGSVRIFDTTLRDGEQAPGAGLDDRLVDLEQVVDVGARGVLGGELDLRVAAELLPAMADPLHGLGQRGLAVHPELVLEVDVARRDEDVEVGSLRDLDRLDRALRVAVAATGKRCHRDAALRLLGNAPNGLEIAIGRGRKAGLDDVDLEPRELPRDFELLGGREACTRCLLAIAERGVEDPDAVLRCERPRWAGC